MKAFKVAVAAAAVLTVVVVIDWLLGFDEMGKAIGND